VALGVIISNVLLYSLNKRRTNVEL